MKSSEDFLIEAIKKTGAPAPGKMSFVRIEAALMALNNIKKEFTQNAAKNKRDLIRQILDAATTGKIQDAETAIDRYIINQK